MVFQIRTATAKENFEQTERLMKLKKEVPKTETDRANEILGKHLKNTGNICNEVDAVYIMGTTNKERKGKKRSEKRKSG